MMVIMMVILLWVLSILLQEGSKQYERKSQLRIHFCFVFTFVCIVSVFQHWHHWARSFFVFQDCPTIGCWATSLAPTHQLEPSSFLVINKGVSECLLEEKIPPVENHWSTAFLQFSPCPMKRWAWKNGRTLYCICSCEYNKIKLQMSSKEIIML